MNAEEIRAKIGFKFDPSSRGTTRVIGSILFSAGVTVDNNILHFGNAIEASKDSVREKILRNIFEDQRRELYEALADLTRAIPLYDLAIQDAMERLLKAAKYQHLSINQT